MSIRIQSLFALVFCLGGPRGFAQNASNPARPYDPDSATVVLYHFTDSTTTTAPDSSGNHLDGFVDAATWTHEGRFGGGLVFDGNDHVHIPNSSLTYTGDATFEAWVYVAQEGSFMAVIERFFPLNGGGRGLGIASDRKAVAYAYYDPLIYSVQSRQALELNKWVHLAAVFDESNQQIRLVVNGALDNSAPLGCCTALPNLAITVGRRNLLTEGFFVGKMDEVRVSSTARRFEPVAVESRNWGEIKRRWIEPHSSSP